MKKKSSRSKKKVARGLPKDLVLQAERTLALVRLVSTLEILRLVRISQEYVKKEKKLLGQKHRTSGRKIAK